MTDNVYCLRLVDWWFFPLPFKLAKPLTITFIIASQFLSKGTALHPLVHAYRL